MDDEPDPIKRLRTAGFILEYYVFTEDAMKYEQAALGITDFKGRRWHSYRIAKPSSIGGNSRFGRETDIESSIGKPFSDDDNETLTNAPISEIYTRYPDANQWYFCVHTSFAPPDHIAGDFTKALHSLEAAVDAVFEYYFGDPSMMNPPGVFERGVHSFVWWPVVEWFTRNWEWVDERKVVTSRDWFTFVYWLAVLERPIDRLVYLYYRLKYKNPNPYYIYRHFLHARVSLSWEKLDGSSSMQKYLVLRKTVAKQHIWPKSRTSQHGDGE